MAVDGNIRFLFKENLMNKPANWTEQLKRMALFAEIVEAGSISAAARRLGTTPSALSQQLRLLEQGLGLSLLHRSTRKLALTEAGERYYPACAAMRAQAQEAQAALQRLRDEPEGELRVAAPIGFGPLLAQAFEPLRQHARLRLHLMLDDTPIDLLHARVDLALRAGQLADSSLVARHLGSLPRQLCAAPAYLDRRGWPQQPDELGAHDWLGLPPRQGAVELLELQGPGGARASLRLGARVLATQVTALQAMAEAGWGLFVAVADDARQALAQGRLVPVLPGWTLAPVPVWAITPRRDELPAKVRHALAALRSHFSAHAGPGLLRAASAREGPGAATSRPSD